MGRRVTSADACQFSWAFCLFAYQSLDSIDGKQARRTGMAGPLGELFDHGCDAINTTVSGDVRARMLVH